MKKPTLEDLIYRFRQDAKTCGYGAGDGSARAQREAEQALDALHSQILSEVRALRAEVSILRGLLDQAEDVVRNYAPGFEVLLEKIDSALSSRAGEGVADDP